MRSAEFDIGNIPQVLIWLTELAKGDPEMFWRLARPNKKGFVALWGRGEKNTPEKENPDDTLHWAWSFREQGLSWYITTGEEGSIYYLRLPPGAYEQDARVTSGVLSFLRDLGEKLSLMDE